MVSARSLVAATDTSPRASTLEFPEIPPELRRGSQAEASACAAIREIRGCFTLLTQLKGQLQSQGSTNISVGIVSQRIQASMLAASPEEFARFWKELLEAASDEQKSAALAVIPRRDDVDYSALTDEELEILERLAIKIRIKT